QLVFKCENLQKAGAFKFRGALNAVLALSNQEVANGVATHSSGNHAAALSLAASLRGVKAHIVMPENAPLVKVDAVKQYGGIITFCEPTLEARETTLAKVVAETGATFIHPYNNFNVVCGQGTAAKELLEEVAEVDVVMAPVGGGGLMSGTSISAKALCQRALIIGAEPKNADDACRSLKTGQLVLSDNPDTIADGLRTSLGDLTWEIIRTNVDDVFTASEESIKAAMVLLRKHAGILAEPSSAVPLAAILENRAYFEGKRVGMIISGGNFDVDKFEF
ncbi:MAG: pyridoxal-phosphate dependent enzyme, partial [Spirochaetales bacterium]|nr:pyridoxal-phosphate dependent enzyme [Spirochaetales bacterium]